MKIENISIKRNSCTGDVYNIGAGGRSLLNIGRGSYIENLSVNSDVIPNIHIGKFSTIKENVTFRLPSNNFYNRITTSDDQHVALPAGIVICDPFVVKGQIIIQNDVWIGENSIIKGGVTVKNGAIIEPNSYVTEDVLPFTIMSGNPAKIIGHRFSEEQIAELQNIAWWEWSNELLEKRKADFALPIQTFIDKYKATDTSIAARKDHENRRILLFPDFGLSDSLWKRVMNEYCELCSTGADIGQLYIQLYNSANTDSNIKELQDFFSQFDEDTGDIVVHVGKESDDLPLFEAASHYVTTREPRTVYHSCLADRFGVNMLSGIDMPSIFGALL